MISPLYYYNVSPLFPTQVSLPAARVACSVALPGGCSAPVAVCSTPTHTLLAAACLSGHLAGLSLEDAGDGSVRVVWTRRIADVPLFAAPVALATDAQVVVVAVDVAGVVTAVGGDGSPRWQVAPPEGGASWGPCFAALLLLPRREGDASCGTVVVVHEQRGVRWLDVAHGTTQRAVHVEVAGGMPTALVPWERGLVGCTSAGVVMMLDTAGGQECAAALPDESFSGVVACDHLLIVGCRDDYLYGITIECLSTS